jgi:pimeloyl-ACP methyl ester carboxylesterase
MATREARAASEDWRQHYPFESRWHEPGVGCGRMHYLDEGPLNSAGVSDAALNVGGVSHADGLLNGRSATESPLTESLLFVHGNPTWSFHWRRLVAALRNRYRCVAPDHIGCGLSDKPQQFFTLNDHIENLSELIETLQLDRVTLIAQDWGGAIGLGAMLQMPHRLQRIVLFNTGAFPPRYIPWRIRACRVPVIGRIAVQGANAFSRCALRMTLAQQAELDPAVTAGYLAPYDSWANRRAVYGFVRDIPQQPRSETWKRLASIERQLPSLADRQVLLIWGMRDWCFQPDCLERFIEAWPQSEVHRLAGVGHWVVEDAPEESLALVERFLDAGVGCQVSGVRSRHPTPDTRHLSP